jgi:hypothetical protein
MVFIKQRTDVPTKNVFDLLLLETTFDDEPASAIDRA